jgi:hypothetical protein
MPKDKRIGYVVELKKMPGTAALAEDITANDPYGPIWGQYKNGRGPEGASGPHEGQGGKISTAAGSSSSRARPY